MSKEFENTPQRESSAVSNAAEVQEGEKGRMTTGLGNVEAFMTLRTAIFMELWAHKVCLTCSQRSAGQDRGHRQLLPSFYCKRKKTDSFYTNVRSRKYCF